MGTFVFVSCMRTDVIVSKLWGRFFKSMGILVCVSSVAGYLGLSQVFEEPRPCLYSMRTVVFVSILWGPLSLSLYGYPCLCLYYMGTLVFVSSLRAPLSLSLVYRDLVFGLVSCHVILCGQLFSLIYFIAGLVSSWKWFGSGAQRPRASTFKTRCRTCCWRSIFLQRTIPRRAKSVHKSHQRPPSLHPNYLQVRMDYKLLHVTF